MDNKELAMGAPIHMLTQTNFSMSISPFVCHNAINILFSANRISAASYPLIYHGLNRLPRQINATHLLQVFMDHYARFA